MWIRARTVVAQWLGPEKENPTPSVPETPAARLARQRREAVERRRAQEAEAAQRLAARARAGQEEIRQHVGMGNWWNPATGDVGGSIGRDYFGAPRRRMRPWRGDPVQAFIDRIREYTR